MNYVDKNMWVKFRYDIKDRESGEIIGSSDGFESAFIGDKPSSNTFEKSLVGRQVGESFTVTMENIYGHRWPHLLSYVNKKDVDTEWVSRLKKPGEKVTMQTNNGVTTGVVRNIFTDAIVIDWNHPESGKTHDCEITVTETSHEEFAS